jgi:dolichyl-phosphate-mannose--protein O-mannosyl transferase
MKARFSLVQTVQYLKQRPQLTAVLAVIGLFILFRIIRINMPVETVFDEVYFPKMAWQYLTGEAFFDIHPPLGKLIIALGESVFGNTQIGWRIMPLLAGIALLPAAYWAVNEVFNDKRAGVLAAFLVAIDGLFIVYSRTGLMDGFIMLFGVLSIGFCWRFRKLRLAGEQAWWPLILTGLFSGLALAVKWIGAGFLPLVAVTAFISLYANTKRQMSFQDFMVWLFSFVALPAVLYIAPFLANWQTNFWTEFAQWHQQSWDYNVHLDATHPYASKWWSWPFLIRPIWFYYNGADGIVTGVDAIGNPLVWWGSTLAVVYTVMVLCYSLLVWKRQDSQIVSRQQFIALVFVLAGWAAFYLPWIEIGRVLFLYHYMSSYIFALFLGAFWLSKAYETRNNRLLIIGLLAAAVVVALAYLPIWVAYPIPQAWFDRLMLFKSWI